MNTFDFGEIYPLMDAYLQTHDLSSPEAIAAVIAEASPESTSFASTLLNIFETTVAERVQEYDILGNSFWLKDRPSSLSSCAFVNDLGNILGHTNGQGLFIFVHMRLYGVALAFGSTYRHHRPVISLRTADSDRPPAGRRGQRCALGGLKENAKLLGRIAGIAGGGWPERCPLMVQVT